MPSKLAPFRLVQSKSLYKGYYIELVKDRFTLPAHPGKIFTRELVKHPGAVVVIPFSGPGRILLLRQFRYAAKGELWEVPAGTLERGENPFLCAKRELEEETGFRARSWKRLCRFFPAPGISDELMTLYAAKQLVPGKKQLDHDEWIEHQEVTLREAERMMRDGRIRDGKTLVSLLWCLRYGFR